MDEKINGKIHEIEENLKVIKMVSKFNELVQESQEARIMYGMIKEHIPAMCQTIREHPQFEEFKDVELDRLLEIWPGLHDQDFKKVNAVVEILEKKLADLKAGVDNENPGK